MKERPILFSTDMVRAILDGRKTQTRRIVKPQPSWEDGPYKDYVKDCRYGLPGDHLWVRETWATPGNYDGIKPSELVNDLTFSKSDITYRASDKYGDAYFKWRPSIYMPRWASRITLEILNVRVERLQEISENDSISEGLSTSIVDPSPRGWKGKNGYAKNYLTTRELFRDLWDSINSDSGRRWDDNPWVWVIEFKRIPQTTYQQRGESHELR